MKVILLFPLTKIWKKFHSGRSDIHQMSHFNLSPFHRTEWCCWSVGFKHPEKFVSRIRIRFLAFGCVPIHSTNNLDNTTRFSRPVLLTQRVCETSTSSCLVRFYKLKTFFLVFPVTRINPIWCSLLPCCRVRISLLFVVKEENDPGLFVLRDVSVFCLFVFERFAQLRFKGCFR